MKSVLMSIAPKWCELIANGEKTIDVRKTKPKIETPFKCYIYCTISSYKGKYLHTSNKRGRLLFWENPNDTNITVQPENYNYMAYTCRGKVIGEFVCDEILDYKLADVSTDVGVFYYYERYITQNVYDINSLDDCLTDGELLDYGNYKNLYGWHISDLKIYDEPKELASFKVEDKHRIERCAARERVYNNPDFTNGAFLKGAYYCNKYNDFCDKCLTKEMTQPPKSWYYVESVIE